MNEPQAKATPMHRETGFLGSSGLSEVLVTKPMTQSRSGSHSDMDTSSGSEVETVLGRSEVVWTSKRVSVKAEDLGGSATSTEISYGYCDSNPMGNAGTGFEEIKVFGYGDAEIGQSTVDRISTFGRLGLRETECVPSDRLVCVFLLLLLFLGLFGFCFLIICLVK